MSLNDPELVRDEYATDAGLAGRQSIYASREGDDVFAMIVDSVREAAPRRVLEVGGGQGKLAKRLVGDLGVELTGIDQSEYMVELQRALGLDARVGDVQDLPFEDASFDCVVAAWMLYHVTDLDRGLSEVARVLRPGGRLVAVVNGYDHLAEAWDFLGGDRSYRHEIIGLETGERMLSPYFARVECRPALGWITMDEEALRQYSSHSIVLLGGVEVPPLAEPLRVRTVNAIFVCDGPTSSRGDRDP